MRSSGRIGPGASTILMILVVLVMTMLGVLSLFSARSDMEMSERTQQASAEYYTAQTEFSLWTSRLDETLFTLREEAAGDAETYARLVREQVGVEVGEVLDYRAQAGKTRFYCASVEILPLEETDRFLILDCWLEANDTTEFEEGAGWTLIA